MACRCLPCGRPLCRSHAITCRGCGCHCCPEHATAEPAGTALAAQTWRPDADALDLWRAGERNVTRRTLSSDWRDDYQAAVDTALTYLQRYTTMAELMTAYFDPDDDAWLDALCRRPSGRILNFGDVEDATYWRRAQQLTTETADASREWRG